MELSITREDTFTIVTVIDKVDWENARILDQKLAAMIEMGSRHIVLVLDKVNFICSGGVGAMVYNHDRLKKLGGSLYIVSNSDYINFMFATLNFGMVFENCFYKTYDEFAAANLGKT